MAVPNADAAIVSQDKNVGYLLNPLHPDGAGKCRFFRSVGFHVDQWEIMADALRELIVRSKTIRRVDSVHGAKYIVDGTIETPSGRSVRVRTVWIMDAGETAPRLVTAYPRD